MLPMVNVRVSVTLPPRPSVTVNRTCPMPLPPNVMVPADPLRAVPDRSHAKLNGSPSASVPDAAYVKVVSCETPNDGDTLIDVITGAWFAAGGGGVGVVGVRLSEPPPQAAARRITAAADTSRVRNTRPPRRIDGSFMSCVRPMPRAEPAAPTRSAAA